MWSIYVGVPDGSIEGLKNKYKDMWSIYVGVPDGSIEEYKDLWSS